MSSQKRITKELGELMSSPPDGITVSLPDESNLHRWVVYMKGPEGTPYEGGTFKILLTLPADYPFKPPTLAFATKIFHPNVAELESSSDSTTATTTTADTSGSAGSSNSNSSNYNPKGGTMCLGMLKQEEWKPSSRIAGVLAFARQLLIEPAPDDAVEGDIAELYNRDRKAFEKKAREWTAKYAK
ncbi:hypothetical protein VTO42DRAFT_3415 [Malbranchea cinnamomea]